MDTKLGHDSNEEAGQKKKRLEITVLNDPRQEESSKGYIWGCH
jgi:hypothetical protein